jgi:hypothetical protein
MSTYYIYKIYCNDDNVTDTYIGSTKNISTRKYQHKQACNNENNSNYNAKVYKIIRANGGWNNWNFAVIEEMKECSRIQSIIREEYYRQEIKANMNAICCFSGMTREEYKKKHGIKYRQDNKEQIKEYQSQPYTCECGGKYTTQHKLIHFKTKKHQNYLANLKEVIV